MPPEVVTDSSNEREYFVHICPFHPAQTLLVGHCCFKQRAPLLTFSHDERTRDERRSRKALTHQLALGHSSDRRVVAHMHLPGAVPNTLCCVARSPTNTHAAHMAVAQPTHSTTAGPAHALFTTPLIRASYAELRICRQHDDVFRVLPQNGMRTEGVVGEVC